MARQKEGGSPRSSVCHPDKWYITILASSPGGARQESGLPHSLMLPLDSLICLPALALPLCIFLVLP